jgi:hypothetical protein
LPFLGNEAIGALPMDDSNFSLTPATPLESENVEFPPFLGVLYLMVATVANVELFT